MDENLHNIENLFRDGLEGNEELPSLNVWNGIDNTLDKDNVVSIKKKYTTMKRVAILLLLLVLGFSVYELSIRHNSEGIAKGNRNDSNNEAINKSNDRETVLPSTTQSKNPIDSISLNNKDKGNSPVYNSISNKNTANNNPPIQSGNNIITENKNASNTNSNSSTQKDNVDKNSSVDNTIADNIVPDNKTMSKNKFKPKIRQGINSNTVADNIVPSKNKRKFSDKGAYRVKISSPLPTEDEQQTVTNNVADETNSQASQLKRLSTVAVDKIKMQRDSVDTKKLLQSLAVNKTTPPLDTKNTTVTNAKKKTGKPSRFSVSAFFSPDIAYYRLRVDKPGNQTDNAAKIEKGEHHEFSSTTGLLVDYKLSKHVALQTGLMFSNINLTVKPKTIYAQPDNNGNIKYRVNISSGYGYLLPSFQNAPVVGDSLYVSGATHKLRYIGIPAAVKYRIVKGKFSIEAMAGIGINFLLKGKLETEIKQGSNNEIDVLNKIEGLKSVYLNGLAGIGAAYKLTDKFSLTLMPTARFALTSINKGAVVKSYPNSFGVAVGIKVKL